MSSRRPTRRSESRRTARTRQSQRRGYSSYGSSRRPQRPAGWWPILAVGALVVIVIAALVLNNGSGSTTGTSVAAVPTSASQGSTPLPAGQSRCIGVKDPAAPAPAAGPKQWTAPTQVINPDHTYCAILTTNKGRIVLELYPKSAPRNVNSFVFLAQQGFYDGVTWHRVLPDFVAQTGDPTGTGSGGPGYNVPLEIDPNLKYDQPGRVGVARNQARDSAGSQFFIALQPLPSLDPHSRELPDSDGYTIMGQVIEGMNIVQQITPRDPERGATKPGDPLLSVRIVDLTASAGQQ